MLMEMQVEKIKKTRNPPNPLLREICFYDYVIGVKLADIAAKHRQKLKTVETWHARHKWKERRHQLLDSCAATHEGALLLMVQDEGLGFAKDQIQTIRRAQEVVRGLLGERGAISTLDAKAVKDLTGAIKTLSDAGGPMFLPKSMQGAKASRIPPLNVNVLVGGARERVRVVMETPAEKLLGAKDDES